MLSGLREAARFLDRAAEEQAEEEEEEEEEGVFEEQAAVAAPEDKVRHCGNRSRGGGWFGRVAVNRVREGSVCGRRRFLHGPCTAPQPRHTTPALFLYPLSRAAAADRGQPGPQA